MDRSVVIKDQGWSTGSVEMSAGISYSANRFAVAKRDAPRARVLLRARDITKLSHYEV